MESSYFECTVVVELESGLHARPAGVLVKIATQYKSKIELEKNGLKKNAKSIMSLMSLGAIRGDQLKLIAEGEDAHVAGTKIQSLFAEKFEGSL